MAVLRLHLDAHPQADALPAGVAPLAALALTPFPPASPTPKLPKSLAVSISEILDARPAYSSRFQTECRSRLVVLLRTLHKPATVQQQGGKGKSSKK